MATLRPAAAKKQAAPVVAVAAVAVPPMSAASSRFMTAVWSTFVVCMVLGLGSGLLAQSQGTGSFTCNTNDGFTICTKFNPAAQTADVTCSAVPTSTNGYVACAASPGSTMSGSTVVYAVPQGTQAFVQNLQSSSGGGGANPGNSMNLTNLGTSTDADSGAVNLAFTVPVGSSLDADGSNLKLLYARGPAGATANFLPRHSTQRGLARSINTITGASALTVDNSLDRLRAAHGWMMCFAWGLLIPLGIIMARYFKPYYNPAWFHAHIAFVMIGLALAFAAWIIALVKLNTGNHPTHRALGITCMSLALAQPFIAALRPSPPGPGEKRTMQRFIWEQIHHWVGRAAYVIAIVNVFIGLSYYNYGSGEINNNTIAFLVCWLVVMAFAIILEIRSFVSKDTPPFGVCCGGEHAATKEVPMTTNKV